MTRCDLSLGFVGLGALGLPMAINLQFASAKAQCCQRDDQGSRKESLKPRPGALRNRRNFTAVNRQNPIDATSASPTKKGVLTSDFRAKMMM